MKKFVVMYKQGKEASARVITAVDEDAAKHCLRDHYCAGTKIKVLLIVPLLDLIVEGLS